MVDRNPEPFNDKPSFADRQMELLRKDQNSGAHLVQVRRSDGAVISVAPDGTETELGYRVTEYIQDLEP